MIIYLQQNTIWYMCGNEKQLGGRSAFGGPAPHTRVNKLYVESGPPSTQCVTEILRLFSARCEIFPSTIVTIVKQVRMELAKLQ